jgi:hypothetical protein
MTLPFSSCSILNLPVGFDSQETTCSERLFSKNAKGHGNPCLRAEFRLAETPKHNGRMRKQKALRRPPSKQQKTFLPPSVLP